MTKEKEGK